MVVGKEMAGVGTLVVLGDRLLSSLSGRGSSCLLIAGGEDVDRLAEVQPHVASVDRAILGVGIIWVLVAVDTSLPSSAVDLNTGAGAHAFAGRADLDVVVEEGCSDETIALAIEVTQVPVESAVLSGDHGILELEDALDALLGDLERGSSTVRDPVEGADSTLLDGPWSAAGSDTGTVWARIATAVVGGDNGNLDIAVVVDLKRRRGTGGHGSNGCSVLQVDHCFGGRDIKSVRVGSLLRRKEGCS